MTTSGQRSMQNSPPCSGSDPGRRLVLQIFADRYHPGPVRMFVTNGSLFAFVSLHLILHEENTVDSLPGTPSVSPGHDDRAALIPTVPTMK